VKSHFAPLASSQSLPSRKSSMAGETDTLASKRFPSTSKWRVVSPKMGRLALSATVRLYRERVSLAFGTTFLEMTQRSHPLSNRHWMGFRPTYAVRRHKLTRYRVDLCLLLSRLLRLITVFGPMAYFTTGVPTSPATHPRSTEVQCHYLYPVQR